MAVNLGYKQTEVGEIPDDWEPMPLGSLAQIATGSTPPTSDRSNYGEDFLFVSPADLGNTKYIRRTGKKLSRKGFLASRRFPKDSVLFVCIGSTIGKCGIASEDLTSNQQINAILPNQNVCSEFVYYASASISATVREQAGEQAVPMINKTQFARSIIPLPPTKAEQEAIAEALSDADALIESLEQLITKKRQIKQGAMQQLLTGQKRLPGFNRSSKSKNTEIGSYPYDWDTPLLEEIVESTQLGGNYSNSEVDTASPLIKMGNLGRGSIKLEKIEYVSRPTQPNERDRLRRHDVLFNTRNTLDLVGKVAIWREELPKAYFNSNIMRIQFKAEKVSSRRFMNYIMNTPSSVASLRAIAIGTTSVAAIYNRDLMRVRVPVPSDPAEQTAIAETLSDMDKEITTLEAKLSKARQLKQGMMQELLTGKTRLV